MNNFVYDIPTKVYFGKDQLVNLGPELKKFGNRVLLTYGGGSIKRMGLYDKVVEEIRRKGGKAVANYGMVFEKIILFLLP